MPVLSFNGQTISTFWVIRVLENQGCETQFLNLLIRKSPHPFIFKVVPKCQLVSGPLLVVSCFPFATDKKLLTTNIIHITYLPGVRCPLPCACFYETNIGTFF